MSTNEDALAAVGRAVTGRAMKRAEPKDIAGRQLPHSPAVEAAFLCSLMSADLSTPETAAAFRLLSPGHLFDPKNQAVFSAMKGLAAQGVTIESVTVLSRLQHVPAPSEGWETYLFETLQVVGARAEARPAEYAKILLDRWRARELVLFAHELAEQGFAGHDSLAMLDTARAALRAIADTRTDVQGMTAYDALKKAWEGLVRARQPGHRGLSWGWPTVDAAFGRLRPTRTTVVAAVPGVGKTNLAWHVAMAAVQEPEDEMGVGEAVYFVSAELKASELTSRQAGIFAGVPPEAIEGDREFTPDELKRLDDVQGDFSSWPIIVDDNGGRPFTVAEIEARVQDAKARMLAGTYTRGDGKRYPRSRIRLVVVDYLQKLRPPALPPGQKYDSREREVGAISGALMDLAKVLDVHVLIVAAVNRGGAKGEDPRRRELQMSDLRESGQIEYDAATIIFANQPQDGVLRLKNAKQRFRQGAGPIKLAMVRGRLLEPEGQP